MTNINAYSVLMFIANIVLAVPIILSVVQQSKASMNIANVVSIVYLVISFSFFSDDFKAFFTKLGISISPVAYAIIAIFTFMVAKNFGELKVRNGMHEVVYLGTILVALNIIDFLVVGNAALISLFSLTWAFAVCIIIGIMKWNVQ